MSNDPKKSHILRAWRDPDYYSSLSLEERAALPANPAAELLVSHDMMENTAGGWEFTSSYCTPCPPKICY